MTELEKKILQRIRDIGGGVSFAELHSIEGFAGDTAFGSEDKNIWYWFSCSEEATEALDYLLATGLIRLKPASSLVYALDGMLPEVPIAQQSRAYKKPHWLPVVLSTLQSQDDDDDDD